jgi:hypothetical protein
MGNERRETDEKNDNTTPEAEKKSGNRGHVE